MIYRSPLFAQRLALRRNKGQPYRNTNDLLIGFLGHASHCKLAVCCTETLFSESPCLLTWRARRGVLIRHRPLHRLGMVEEDSPEFQRGLRMLENPIMGRRNLSLAGNTLELGTIEWDQSVGLKEPHDRSTDSNN